MASNLVERVHTPQFLQGVALGFRVPELVADIVAPAIRVNKQTDKYRVWGKDAFRVVDADWAFGAIPNAIKTEMSEGTYYAAVKKIRHQLLDAEQRNADDVDLRRRYTENVTQRLLLARESRVATAFRLAANYPGANVITKAGAAEWDAVGVINTVQPITDIETQIGVVEDSAMVGREQITVVIPSQVMRKTIRHNTAIRDYFKYTMGGVLTEDILASLLGVRRVVIAKGMATTAVENVTADIVTGITTTNLWGDDVWVGVTDDSNNDMMMSFARTFLWTGETAGQDIQIRQYRSADEGQELDWIEAKEARDEKIVANFAGALIKNTLA